MKNNNKTNNRQMLVSVLALLVIIVVAIGITFSWVEGGTSYNIKTKPTTDVKTGTVPPTIPKSDSLVKLNPMVNTTFDLNKFDTKTNSTPQGLIFAEASSADGENFYFPTKFDSDGNPTAYRKANTNDIGTKFINYSFDVQASKKCYLAFDKAPSFNVTKGDTTITDTSDFRIMIKCGDEKKILTTAENDVTDTINVDGTPQTVTVQSVNKYIYNHADTSLNKMFEFEKEDKKTITVSIWLNGKSATSELLGSLVTANMNLKVARETKTTQVYVEPRNYSAYYGYAYNDDKDEYPMGAWTGTELTLDTGENTNYYYSQDVDAGDNYNFVVNNNNGTQYPSKYSTDKKTVDISGEPNYNGKYVYVLRATGTFVKFDPTKITTTAKAVAFDSDEITKLTDATNFGTVKIDDNTTNVEDSKTIYKDQGTTTQSVTATEIDNSHFTFSGWYKDENCKTPVDSKAQKTYSYTANEDGKYFAKFVKEKNYDITFDSCTFSNTGTKLDNGFTGGSITVDGAKHTSAFTKNYYISDTFSATANVNNSTAYIFKGWYDNENCTGTAVTTSNTISKQPTETKTYYAKFVEKNKYNVVLSSCYQTNASTTTVQNDKTGGNVTVNNVALTALPTTYSDYDGTSVTAVAVANEHYTFKGWFTTSDCTGSAKSTDTTIKITRDGANQSYYALFKEDAKYTVSVTTVTTPSGVGGTANINGSGTSITEYNNSNITLNAVANDGYRFDGWYVNDETTARFTDTSHTLTVSENITYKAKFVKQYTVTLTSVTDGEVSATGGSVQLGTDTAGDSVTKQVDANGTVELKATQVNGYAFQGFYDAVDGGNLISLTTPKSMEITDDTTVYARFKTDRKTTTIYFEDRSGYSSYYAWVYNKTTESILYTTTTTKWPGDKMSVDEFTGMYKFEFTTTDTGSFRVIVSDNGNNKYPSGTNTPGLEGTIGGTYLFKSGSPTALQEYTPVEAPKTVTIKSVTDGSLSGTGGTVKIDSGTAGSTATASVTKGTNVQFTATANTNYKFVGFYTEQTGGTKLSDTSPYSETINSSVTYYARFEVVGVTITFDSTNLTGIADSSPNIYLYDTSTSKSYLMTKNDYKWTVIVPDTVKNIQFLRKSPITGTQWNYWNAGNRYSSTLYKVSGWGTGSWQ